VSIKGARGSIIDVLFRIPTPQPGAEALGQRKWAGRRKINGGAASRGRRRRAQGATLVELARSYGVGKSTISRLGYIGALSMRSQSPGAA